jgi:peptide/nickel transport system permease protein
MQLIGKGTNVTLHNDYIESERMLGERSGNHVLLKHVIPALKGNLLLIFTGQLIAVMTLMMHVANIGFFIPGWTHSSGSNNFELMISPCVIFFPVLLFTLLISSLTQ